MLRAVAIAEQQVIIVVATGRTEMLDSLDTIVVEDCPPIFVSGIASPLLSPRQLREY